MNFKSLVDMITQGYNNNTSTISVGKANACITDSYIFIKLPDFNNLTKTDLEYLKQMIDDVYNRYEKLRHVHIENTDQQELEPTDIDLTILDLMILPKTKEIISTIIDLYKDNIKEFIFEPYIEIEYDNKAVFANDIISTLENLVDTGEIIHDKHLDRIYIKDFTPYYFDKALRSIDHEWIVQEYYFTYRYKTYDIHDMDYSDLTGITYFPSEGLFYFERSFSVTNLLKNKMQFHVTT